MEKRQASRSCFRSLLERADLSALWVRGGLSPRSSFGELNVGLLRQVAGEPRALTGQRTPNFVSLPLSRYQLQLLSHAMVAVDSRPQSSLR
jgi:hypothetical protein